MLQLIPHTCVEQKQNFKREKKQKDTCFILFLEGDWQVSLKNSSSLYSSSQLLYIRHGIHFNAQLKSDNGLCYVFYIENNAFTNYCKSRKEFYEQVMKTSSCSVSLTNSQYGYLSYLLSQLIHSAPVHSDSVAKHFLSNALFACFTTGWNTFGDTYSVYPLDIIRRMDSYLDLSIPVSAICDHYPISQTSLVNEFKQLSGGYTIVQYRHIKRMEYAAHLLTAENRSVTDVASVLNISSLSYFSEQFKKHYGLSPRQYQLAYRKEKNEMEN